MAYLIHVTTGQEAISHQIHAAQLWATEQGHTIVQVVPDDQKAAFKIAKTVGCEVIETVPGQDPYFLDDPEGIQLSEPTPPPPVPPVPAKGKGAPSTLRPAVTASAPPPVGGPKEGPKANLESIVAPVETQKVGKKGTRRSGPTAKNRKELERLKPIMAEYAGQSAKACAKMLNEREVLLPSGVAGTWQGTQVTRVRKHLEEIYGKPDSPTT